jgi:hypothetical protein
MRTLIVLILAAGLAGFAAVSPSLSTVHKVYLMPMSGGLDQFLAEQLTAQRVFTVVVDPKQADAVWSERVGPEFTETLKDLYPAPKAPGEKGERKEDGAITQDKPPIRSLGRPRGTVFLVAVGSRQVIWSTYLQLNDRSPKGLHRAAQGIVKQLKKDLAGKE